jgi:hypothetical protein
MKKKPEKKQVVPFNIRLPYKNWLYLKTHCMKRGIAMNTVLVELLENYQKGNKKGLTPPVSVDTIASLQTNTEIEK